MAESSRFWTTDGASPDAPAAGYSADQFAAFMEKAFSSGVLTGIGGELTVSGTGSPLAVATGACFGSGYFHESTAVENVTVTSPSATTGFRIVVRFTWSVPEARIKLSISADGVPTPPALVQTPGTVWEVNLATGSITSAGAITLDTSVKELATFSTKVPPLDPDTVDTVNIVDGAIEEEKIGAGEVVQGKLGTDSVIETNILDEAVTRLKLGDGALRIPYREGGHADHWYVPGSTTYVPAIVEIQIGSVELSMNDGVDNTNSTITYPQPFVNAPIIFLSTGYGEKQELSAHLINYDDFLVVIERWDSSGYTEFNVHWMAIGGPLAP